MTLAHVGGVPIEELVPTLAPAAAASITMAMTWLRRR
jgi:hypothetical protein